MKSFFIFCSGVHPSFLKRSPSEVNKYVGIGATIFFTGVLAFFSSAYAFHTVFHSVTASILLGLVWGAMIFNLDRYIVSSLKKTESKWSQFLMAIPRMIFACLIAIVISKPIEMKLFESEIDAQIVKMEQEVYKEQEDLLRKRYESDILDIKTEIDDLEENLAKKESHKNTLINEAVKEADGTGGSQIRNMGPIYRMKKQEADIAIAEYESEENRVIPIIEEKRQHLQEIQNAEKMAITELNQVPLNGFASRLEALSILSRDKESILLASLFITLLFIALEMAPIFVKLISNRGPVDYLQNKHENYYIFSHDLALNDLKLKQNYLSKTKAFQLRKVVEQENQIFTQALDNELKNAGEKVIDFAFYKLWKKKLSEVISKTIS